MTARDVAERLRVRAEIDAYLNAIVLTVARMNGAKPDDGVSLNRMGTGIILTPAVNEPEIWVTPSPDGKTLVEVPSEAVTPPAPLEGGQKKAK